MHRTRNHLPEPVRKRVCKLLNARLADAIDLHYQAKQAHWNVRGPNFIALHELFDKVFEEVTEYVDTIAERIVQLGGTAYGTVRVSAAESSLKEYPLEISSGEDHVQALSKALAAFGDLVRSAIEVCDKAGDKDSADICTEVSRGVDKYLWFVESNAP